jgi:hypothetical protein
MIAKRRFQQVVVILVLALLVAGVAIAGKNADYLKLPTAKCTLTSVWWGIEPEATGQAKLTDAGVPVSTSNPWLPPSVSGPGTGKLSVSCRDLTPGKTYSVEYDDGGGRVSLGQFTTNKRGELRATGVVSFIVYNYYGDGWVRYGAIFAVVVVNATGEEVLQGTLHVE